MKNLIQKPIKKVALLLLALIAFNGIQAQLKYKDYLICAPALFVSGMLDGTIESISYHYENGFKPRFQNSNDQFWNPAISWKNKYKNNNPQMGPKFAGSTTIFAFTTDAYHLLRTSKRTIDTGVLAYYANKSCSQKVAKQKRWKAATKDFLFLTAIRCAGFHLTYTVLFNPNQRLFR